MGLIQYIKDTQGELSHVAWPTRVQTIVFTVLVILLSAFISLYLGVFDYLFTTGLGEVVGRLPQSAPAIELEGVETEPVIETSLDGEPTDINVTTEQ